MDIETAPPAEPTPQPAAPGMERLDSRLVPYWILVNLITTVVLAAALYGGVLYLREEWPDHRNWAEPAAWGALAMLLVSSMAQPVLAYMTWRYSIDDELLIARYGILFREEKTIPISRLQHVDLRRGPVERLFSLSTLVVFTAGTEGTTFRLPGLTVDRARDLRDRILAARGDDVI